MNEVSEGMNLFGDDDMCFPRESNMFVCLQAKVFCSYSALQNVPGGSRLWIRWRARPSRLWKSFLLVGQLASATSQFSVFCEVGKCTLACALPVHPGKRESASVDTIFWPLSFNCKSWSGDEPGDPGQTSPVILGRRAR